MLEKAVLVHIGFPKVEKNDVDEFHALAVSAGAEVCSIVTGTRQIPDAKYFIGTGKLEQVRAVLSAEKAKLLLVDHDLSPSQERNLERALECRVLDRTGLILDIFAQRARTFEGKLQVELAQLEHMSTRLVRGWTHLERQAGGIGLRGPGETQLETDRRLIREKIKTIKKRLEKVAQQRSQSRRARQRAQLPTLSLVGYTNAGKSTLFNRLTAADVYAANQLFATLDPTLRQIKLPEGTQAILVDTVGFIKHLPHDLVDAFRATLEESRLADVLLHVIDVNDEERHGHIDAVNEVLQQIGADHVPQIEVFNKIDLTETEPRIDYDEEGKPTRVWLSARTGQGIDLLFSAIIQSISEERIHCCLKLAAKENYLLAKLQHWQAVISESMNEHGEVFVEISVPAAKFRQLF